MNDKYTYSIAIRTLGTSGEKYKKLLDSIRNLTIQPEKIIVVLPVGYEVPAYRIGTECFVFSEKSMILQRLKALEYIASDYTLFCDDDIEFEPLFVEKLLNAFSESGCVCSSGPLLDFFPPKKIKYLFASLLGGACVMLRKRTDTYVRILKTGGWSYNRSIDTSNHRIYKTESLPWTCFLINTQVMKEIHFEDELWAERTGYAAFEDRVMFYKLLKNGYKTCVVSDAVYKHNDAKTSTNTLRLEPIYARAFNHYVFWHRYLYCLSKSPIERVWMKICISYYIAMSGLHNQMFLRIGKRNKELVDIEIRGFNDAKKFVNSEEYRLLPKVILKQ